MVDEDTIFIFFKWGPKNDCFSEVNTAVVIVSNAKYTQNKLRNKPHKKSNAQTHKEFTLVTQTPRNK